MLSDRVLLLSILVSSVVGQGTLQQPLGFPYPSHKRHEWNRLKEVVGDRLHEGSPLAKPCFEEGFNSATCKKIQEGYTSEDSITAEFGGYVQAQWGTCQITGKQCLLSSTDPHDSRPTEPPQHCDTGSVSEYYIDVHDAKDVAAAFEFSRNTEIPLVIKNTGHDYKGRSSAPGSLALWTHNLKNISLDAEFVPEGCQKASSGMTFGAGVQWGQAYGFAEANNVTIVGGSDRTVGAAGGWLLGGGHGALSNTMGLGADRVLQYKVVTPDGVLRVANECQNEDLFWALRGGGGGTFGVVLEATVLASPQVTLQAIIFSFPANAERTKELWEIMTDNGLKWAEEGWGGFSMANVAILINPKISKEDAAKSLEPLVEFGKRLQDAKLPNVSVVVTEFPSWHAFFDAFSRSHVAKTGQNLALASRLINKGAFTTPEKRAALVDGLIKSDTETPGLIILISAPSTFEGRKGATSVTPAWRDSLYHITVVSTWEWNSTQAEKRAGYDRVSKSIDHLRKITPDGAYVNEADVYEPNHQQAFWGDNYPELLRIKKKYDPDHLLDCWHCVGWNPESPRFSCYL